MPTATAANPTRISHKCPHCGLQVVDSTVPANPAMGRPAPIRAFRFAFGAMGFACEANPTGPYHDGIAR